MLRSHAPLAAGDLYVSLYALRTQLRSTPPSRRATRQPQGDPGLLYVAIHAPLAEGDSSTLLQRRQVRVAIHAPLAEGDGSLCSISASRSGCDPRPPRGGRQSPSGARNL